MVHFGNQQYYGLSTDTKPVPADTAVGATYEETDTGNKLINNGTGWVLFGVRKAESQTISIYKEGANTVAYNNRTGASFTHSNFDNVLTSVINSISPAGTATSIELGEGDFPLAAAFTAIDSTKVGNIKIKGQGPGITNIYLQTGATRGFLIEGAVAVGKALTANTTEALNTVTMSTANAATFAAGDYVLLRSDKTWATATSAVGRQGEIHRIKSVDTGTGIITLRESVMDTYATTDNSVLAKITMLQNITLEDLRIAPKPDGTYTGQTNAILYCKWIDNLQLRNVEVADSTLGGGNNINLQNCINSRADVICTQTGAYPFVELPATGQYGVYVAVACQHLKINITGRGLWRHLITGGATNSNLENAGIPRDITVSGTSETGYRNIWDWHADGDGIVFKNCNTSIAGNYSDLANVVGGIGVRCKNVTITGCNLRMCTYTSIVCSELASNTVIAGNQISHMRKLSDAGGGIGIRLTANITGCVITGNVLYDVNSTNSGIIGDDANHNTVISGNTLINSGGMSFTNATDVIITGNRHLNAGGRPIRMLGTSDFWTIMNNNFRGSSTAILLAGTNNKVKYNHGYVTESSGTATITAAATSIVVTHGLGATPALQNIIVTRTNNPTNAGEYWVSTPTATQFTINVSAAPGASTATFVWRAEL